MEFKAILTAAILLESLNWGGRNIKAWIRDGSLSHITLECVRDLSADQNTLDAIAHRAGLCEGWVIFFLCPTVCVGCIYCQALWGIAAGCSPYSTNPCPFQFEKETSHCSSAGFVASSISSLYLVHEGHLQIQNYLSFERKVKEQIETARLTVKPIRRMWEVLRAVYKIKQNNDHWKVSLPLNIKDLLQPYRSVNIIETLQLRS